MRKEITEAQITELMQAIPRAEEVDRQRAENERLDLDLQRLSAMGSNNKWLLERLAEQRKVIERLRAALEYMVNVCPAIDPDGDRAHEQARKALEGKP